MSYELEIQTLIYWLLFKKCVYMRTIFVQPRLYKQCRLKWYGGIGFSFPKYPKGTSGLTIMTRMILLLIYV